MKHERLALDRVSLVSGGSLVLDALSLSLYAGEVLGLLPVNSQGLDALVELIRDNSPLHYGFVRFDELPVNDYRQQQSRPNRVAVIDQHSRLVNNLSVADNLFVLRKKYRGWLIRKPQLADQVQRLARHYGLDLSANSSVDQLPRLQRWSLEILQTVLGGARLLVIRDILDQASATELAELKRLMQQLCVEGQAFLLVANSGQKLLSMCTRLAILKNGQLVRVLDGAKLQQDVLEKTLAALSGTGERRVPAGQPPRRGELAAVATSRSGAPVLEIRKLRQADGTDFSLLLSAAEIKLVHDADGLLIRQLEEYFATGGKAQPGSLLLRGRPLVWPDRRLALVDRTAARSCLFPELSYLDNLAFMADHRLTWFWSRPRLQRSVRKEFYTLVGPLVDEPSLARLTAAQCLELLYYRIFLQRPVAAVCLDPFSGLDIDQQTILCRLFTGLRDRGIAVLVVAGANPDQLPTGTTVFHTNSSRA